MSSSTGSATRPTPKSKSFRRPAATRRARVFPRCNGSIKRVSSPSRVCPWTDLWVWIQRIDIQQSHWSPSHKARMDEVFYKVFIPFLGITPILSSARCHGYAPYWMKRKKYLQAFGKALVTSWHRLGARKRSKSRVRPIRVMSPRNSPNLRNRRTAGPPSTWIKTRRG